MVNFIWVDYGYIFKCQSDLVITKESKLPAWNKPYHTNKGILQKEEIENMGNYALLYRCVMDSYSLLIQMIHFYKTYPI